MSYLALYRKYRPSELNEVVGQDEIKKILASSVKNGTITHAYLFSGPRGTGKTTMAKILAKMVNCEKNDLGNACNKCDSCLNILKSSDIIEIDAASNNGVDEIRDLREKATLVPSNAKYKVYIIDEVHMLTMQAFNALLKILEEPPKHVIFILATTEYHKIPLTIASRCQKFQFNKLTDDEIVDKLLEIALKEEIVVDKEALLEIAKISEGGMRDAINYLDQIRSFTSKKITVNDVYEVCGNVSFVEMKKLLVDMVSNNVSEVVSFFELIDSSGKSYKKLFDDLVCLLKDIVLFKDNVSLKHLKYDSDEITEIEKLYSLDDIFYIIERINCLLERLKYVSRQSVYVITEFLAIMSKLNKTDDMKDNFAKTSDFTSENIDDNSKLTVNSVKDDVLEEESSININQEIIINNTLAVASKKVKNDLQKKFAEIEKYLSDKKYSSVAGIMVDTILEVAGDGYVIFSAKYDEIVNKVNKNYKMCNNLVNKLFGENYNFVVITENLWNEYKEEYIKNIKLGKKYEIKELKSSPEIVSKKNTVVDKLFDLVGEDVVEFK